jgi:hypothetical protein
MSCGLSHQVAELIDAVILDAHPHFRNVVGDAVPFVAVKLADLQGDETLQHIEAFLEEARSPCQDSQAIIRLHLLACGVDMHYKVQVACAARSCTSTPVSFAC